MKKEDRFRAYETDYLRRKEEQIDGKSYDKIKDRIKSISNSPLDSWDYALLDCMHRGGGPYEFVKTWHNACHRIDSKAVLQVSNT